MANLLATAGARLHFDQRTRGMLAVLMLIVAVIAAAVAWFVWPRPQPLPTAMAVAQTHNDAEKEESGGQVMVSVVGDVAEPGLVEVSAGARVADAIEAAGGLRSETESAGYLNLARKVSDGELIVVDGDSEDPQGPAGPGDSNDSDGGTGSAVIPGQAGAPSVENPVNLNQATGDQLVELPGVGPVMAQRIVDYRDKNGGFDSVDQLGDVDGIGPATLDKLSKLVTV